MASVGKQEVQVVASPKVAVISTGDELVDISVKPESHQIRMSNSYMLAAALQTWSIKAQLFHLTDDPEVLTEKLTQILEEHDVILLSGGVSAGKKDYVPEILAQLGVKKYFHKVAQKPGKPFWFGVKDIEHSEGTKLVFALPGNPVSTFLCFCKYALPVIAQQKPRVEQVSLAKEVFSNQRLRILHQHRYILKMGKYWLFRLRAVARQILPI
jgi:molybdopterin molybdotransferase